MPQNIIPFIFASGLGTRLRPLTNDTPKPLLTVKKDLTILDFILKELTKNGFKQAFINYSYRLDLYQALAERHPEIELTLVDDENIAGQGGILLKEKNRLQKFDFVLGINGDSIIEGALPSFISCTKTKALCLLSNNNYPVTRNLICDEQGAVYGVNPRPTFSKEYWYRPLKSKQNHNNFLGYLLMPTSLLDMVNYKGGFMSIFRKNEIVDQLINSQVEVKTCQREVELFLSANTEQELQVMQKALQ